MPNNSNKVKFGLKNVHVAPLTFEENGAPSFGAPRGIPGAVNLSMDPQGDNEKFYADNGAYYVTYANDGYSGPLEMALIPDWFRREYLGEVQDSTSKVQMEMADAEPKPFALLFQFEGDKRAIRHVLYNCTASRVSVSSSTTSNTKTPVTETLNLTAAPLANGMVKARSSDETPEATLAAWFENVWVPPAAQGTSEG